jgi:hypothetical protein
MRKKKGLRYSYTNHDSRESNFINKNLNKTNSYHTNFSGAKFANTSLVGAKFKFCAFYGAEFDGCYIRGSLFRKCNLQTSTFRDCIISASTFERCKLKGARFERCKIVSSTRINEILPAGCFVNVEFFEKYPIKATFDPVLINIVKELRRCDLIRQSTVLHRKEGKLDTVSLKMLVDIFGKDFLINHLGDLPGIITNEFYSLSYIVRFLQKLAIDGIKKLPGSAALGAPKLSE